MDKLGAEPQLKGRASGRVCGDGLVGTIEGKDVTPRMDGTVASDAGIVFKNWNPIRVNVRAELLASFLNVSNGLNSRRCSLGQHLTVGRIGTLLGISTNN